MCEPSLGLNTMICEAMANANLIGSKEKHKKNVEDVSSLMSSLRGCAKRKDLYNGEKLHEEIVKRGLLWRKNIVLGNALVDMYAKCGMLRKGRDVLEELHTRDVVSWNTLISGKGQKDEQCLTVPIQIYFPAISLVAQIFL